MQNNERKGNEHRFENHNTEGLLFHMTIKLQTIIIASNATIESNNTHNYNAI